MRSKTSRSGEENRGGAPLRFAAARSRAPAACGGANMMQAMRSATEARRSKARRGSVTSSIADFGEVMGRGASLDTFRNSKEQMETIRFQQQLMQAEELAIRKMRNAELRQGGLLLRVFGIGKAYGGMPGSKLVHPQSAFASVWLIVSALLLVYSALCSSFYVGFLWQSTLCETPPPTLHFDMFVDVFFLVEIVITFFTGATIKGEYNDTLSEVAAHYLFRGGFVGGFFFDLGTSIPVSFVEYVLLQKCDAMLATGGEFNAGILRIMRTSKALRVARLLRAIKVIARLKSIMEFVAFIGDYLRIPPYVLRVLKILMMIAMLVHLCTCAWWLIKTESNEPHVLHNFLAVSLQKSPTATTTLAPRSTTTIRTSRGTRCVPEHAGSTGALQQSQLKRG